MDKQKQTGKNKHNTRYALYPVTADEIQEANLPACPNGVPIGGLLLAPSEVERAYHRWLKSDDLPHPYTSEQASDVIKALRANVETLEDDLRTAKTEKQNALSAVEQANTEMQEWVQRNHTHITDKQELLQSVNEAQALQKEAEQERAVSDNLATARESEKAAAEQRAERLQKTIDRYREKYQDIDRDFNRWQRFGAWLFGI